MRPPSPGTLSSRMMFHLDVLSTPAAAGEGSTAGSAEEERSQLYWNRKPVSCSNAHFHVLVACNRPLDLDDGRCTCNLQGIP
mmetsp:Transcript_37733/g.106632  ORF Transcript_37733/g.106632 Transcript_37733/m.106632 type:complete len:82 (-) Transcript_37733:1078-1323(-)